jgi:methyl-accepting chemotaxis protein
MLKNIKIRTRLLFGFSVLLLFLGIIGGFAIVKLNSLAGLTTRLYNHPLAVSNAVLDADTHIIKMHRGMKDVALSRDEDQLQAAIKAVNAGEKEVYKELEIVKSQFLGDTTLVDEITRNFAGWKDIRDEVIDLIKDKKSDEAAAITKGKGARYVENLEKEMNYFIDFAGNMAAKFYTEARKDARNAYIVMGAIALLAIVIAVFIAFSITNSITQPLNQAVSVAEHLAGSDISIDIADDLSQDETGMLVRSMKDMVHNLRRQIREIKEGVDVLAGSATEISATTSQYASSFSQIASSISETVSSMKEVKQTSELSSDKARYVAESSRNVVQVSQDGEKAVNETVSSMNSIQEQMVSIAESIVGLSEQTQSIGNIITVVDDIAEQSRLLAVNASIEAVKAGEHGKGFSVVAGEIKSLAQQSKQSTNQVRGILSEIQKATSNSVMVTEKGNKTVDGGVKQAIQTGDAIQVLARSIAESSQAATQIEATARQQLAGIGQIFSAMETINDAITQNAEGARQLESSARNLEDLGTRLKTIVDGYKI